MSFRQASLKIVGLVSLLAGLASLLLAAALPAYAYLMSLDANQREAIWSVIELVAATAGDGPLGRWARNPSEFADLHWILAALPYEVVLPGIGLVGVLLGLTFINRAEIIGDALMPDRKKKDYVSHAHRDGGGEANSEESGP